MKTTPRIGSLVLMGATTLALAAMSVPALSHILFINRGDEIIQPRHTHLDQEGHATDENTPRPPHQHAPCTWVKPPLRIPDEATKDKFKNGVKDSEWAHAAMEAGTMVQVKGKVPTWEGNCFGSAVYQEGWYTNPSDFLVGRYEPVGTGGAEFCDLVVYYEGPGGLDLANADQIDERVTHFAHVEKVDENGKVLTVRSKFGCLGTYDHPSDVHPPSYTKNGGGLVVVHRTR